MKIIKNEYITSGIIKKLRELIKSEDKKAKHFLGINSKNIVSSLPIKNRNFEMWSIIIENAPIGFLSFCLQPNGVVFIKTLYISNCFRRKGYGTIVIKKLNTIYDRLECIINKGNEIAYRFYRKMGFKPDETSTPLDIFIQRSYLDHNECSPLWKNY